MKIAEFRKTGTTKGLLTGNFYLKLPIYSDICSARSNNTQSSPIAVRVKSSLDRARDRSPIRSFYPSCSERGRGVCRSHRWQGAVEGVDLAALQEISGIGPSKAYLLAAALEFARRRIRPEGIRITCARDVLPLVNHLLDRPQEHVITISLSGAHEVIRVRTVSIGLLTSCPVHPREVFVGPICDHAYSIILAHNHPSGDPAPSEEDRKVTRQLKAAASTLGLRLLDHIIFAKRGYFSFQEQGEL
jgi:DNA repair protein RadC